MDATHDGNVGWMDVGFGSREEVEAIAAQIKVRWHGRYDLEVADEVEAGNCRLRLRHHEAETAQEPR